MSIPDYQTIMLPLLRLARDGNEHEVQETINKIGTEFGLTVEERDHLLPSGRKTVISDRVQWAKTYLSQAGLLESTRRAHFRITDRGLAVLQRSPTKIDIKFLSQFPEFKAFLTRQRQPSQPKSPSGNIRLDCKVFGA